MIFNVLGRKKKDEETISDLLIRQVSSPVLFEDSLKSMEAEAVDIMIETSRQGIFQPLQRKPAEA